MRKCYLLAVSAVLVTATTGAYAAGGEIAVIVKTVNSNYWQNVQKGAKTAVGEAKGYTMTFQGPAAESAIADEVNMVENAVNRKVAGIVLAPSDPDALVPAIKKAWEAHIPVVLIDSSLSDEGAVYTIEHIAGGPANTAALAKVPDAVFQNLHLNRDVETFLQHGIFQRPLKNKEKIIEAWTELRAGVAPAPEAPKK